MQTLHSYLKDRDPSLFLLMCWTQILVHKQLMQELAPFGFLLEKRFHGLFEASVVSHSQLLQEEKREGQPKVAILFRVCSIVP